MENNVYALVTERIIEKLNAGIIPWRKTWVSGPAKSLTTKKEYRGLNSLVLRCSEFTSRYYVTYRQAKKLGGQVRKGEKATPVIYWHWRSPEEIARLEASGKAKDASPCYPFISFVFNLDQVEGIERPGDDVPLLRAQTVEKAERIVKEMPAAPEIKHGASLSPCYSLIFDLVEMPNIGQFESGAHYFSALFHELSHSTAHPRRLNRVEKRKGLHEVERYSYEELVAELGASFLCSEAGIENSSTITDSASYINGWLLALKWDKKLLITAASAAQKAADFILKRASFDERGEAEGIPIAA